MQLNRNLKGGCEAASAAQSHLCVFISCTFVNSIQEGMYQNAKGWPLGTEIWNDFTY